MDLQIKPLTLDLGKLDGLSQKLVASHHENNYAGAVRRLAAIRKQLGELDWSSAPVFVINGLKREELVAANSAFLHELYFDALGGDGVLASNGLSVALTRDFGSVDRWRAEFTALAKAMGGGSGWAILAWSAYEERLINHWAADHTNLLAGATPVLALDMYEHSYHMDFGAKAAAYVDAFMKNIRWDAVHRRYAAAVASATITVASALLAAGVSAAQVVTFDKDKTGASPVDWTCGVTGRGTPRWTVEPHPDAPSASNVLMQSGTGDFPWCVRAGSAIQDGFVEVKFKPLRGREDQAGGVVWRWKDGNNYYVARANALENNVSLYYTERGSRRTLKYVDAPVAANAWHTLRVEFKQTAIRVLFDGKAVIEFDDSHIAGPGAVGVWTKADSVTAFDDFSFGAAP